MIENLIDLDKALFLWINNQWSTPLVDYLCLYFVTWWGKGWIVVPLVLISFAIKGRECMRQHLFWFLLAMLLAGACVFLLKKAVPRGRPLTEFAPLIEAGKVYVHVLGERLWYRSFPSGDAQTAFTAATYLTLIQPRWGIPLSLLAAAVGVSRIYMGAHFPLDVLAGAFIGVGVAMLVWWVRKRFPSISSRGSSRGRK